ncbi:hypothetical protein Glove_310g13 [Diversispora epigaea]|uniref:Protein kinase domain-containing protein n=1 Tax=Diversispora epigaea TaxID=1348612 RepID=A0A397HZ91_9GLOM|nr:hypothetical protein Glove_310g13 [Diversispora epigaea]
METICYNEIETTEEENFQWYLKLAEAGNHIEQNNLGNCYRNGIGTTKDEEKAFLWYLKSAEGEDHEGQYNLGNCYRNGIGTTKDEEKAFLWYLKSAEGGNHGGQNSLGECYCYGIGVREDGEKAFQWYLKSAEGGNNSGQVNLGYCNQYGIGTTKDKEKAFQWYLKSAEGGNHEGQNILGYCYQNGIGTTEDEEKAFQWYLKSAEAGSHMMQYSLGCCYKYGIGTIKDEEKAFLCYLKSAEGGNHEGQNILGYCYQHGIGTMKDEEKAFQWYLKSAEGGNHGGQNSLGECYCYGIGVREDGEKAFQWYLKSAEGGNNSGQVNLGYCNQYGIGTTKDKEKAFQWYLKSAKGGNHEGQNILGYCYQNGIGTTEDEEKAFQWYLKSAEAGSYMMQYSLGCCYKYGIGTIKDEEKAFLCYLKSAEAGNHEGQNILGYYYKDGIGTTKDEEKAFQWYLKSAEGGNNTGQNSLGDCYYYGTGVREDKEKAFQWYLKSAEGGNLLGQNNLGYCYQNGIGTTKDEEKAFQWYLKSAEEGDRFGKINLSYYYRNEIGILKMKKHQNKLKCRCHNCKELNLQNNACLNCKLIKMPKWTSGNNEIDKIIQMTQSDDDAKEWEIWRWINYSKFKDIEYLAEGGFGSIWKAEWIDMPEELFEFYKSNQVALKKLKNSQEISSEFLKELKANFQCRDRYVLPILGITQDPKTKEYVMVLRYMKNGNLRDFLKQNKSLPWIERLWLLNTFIRGLEVIHSKGLIHRDLHPGNLMITEAYNNSKYKFIRLGDLGLCRLANEISSSGAYGILPYIAPEVLNKYQYTQASDIYSVGIIMWIISTGKIPFAIRAYDSELAVDIFNGLRPKINRDTPQCYVELMKKCWHEDPTKRPNAKIIFDTSEKWIKELMYEELMYNKKTEHSLILGDLGLCRLANEISSSGAYGILPYIAPEVLNKYQYTQASDIYSVGIIMWIISTGKIPFAIRAYDSELAVDIFNGLRPKINRDTPQCYVELMKKCWHEDPTKRPNAKIIFDTSEKWIKELMYEELMYNKKTEHSLMFLKANEKMQYEDFESSSAETTHSEAYLTSHLLPSLLPSSILKFDINQMDFKFNDN